MTTPTPTPSLEEPPSKTNFQTEVIGGEYSQRVRDYFFISRGGLRASVSCNKLDPKFVSSEKIGWLVGYDSSLII
jgi:hypothetical protein